MTRITMMAMKVITVLRPFNLRMGLLACVGVFMTAGVSQAGFEWIPAQPAPPAPPPAVETAPSPQPPAQDLLMQAPQPLSPLPGEAAPVAAPAPTPTPIAEPVIKVKNMQPAPAPAPMAEPPQVVDENVETPIKTRVIMPADAPDSARGVDPEQEILAINPFPKGSTPVVAPAPRQAAPAMQAAEMPAVSDAPEVVGFGSDMPLALALQQIAPPGYAFSFGETINPGAKVSWNGGKPWLEVMHDMIAPLGLKADVRGKVIFVHHEQHSSSPAPTNAIEPSAGSEAGADASALLAEDKVPALRRSRIQDPGQTSEEQPVETLSALEKQAMNEPQVTSEPAQRGYVWEAQQGDSLKQTLTSWGKTGDFEVEWQAMHDFTIQSDILVAGKLQHALKTLINTGLPQSAPSLTFTGKSESTPNPKLVVKG